VQRVKRDLRSQYLVDDDILAKVMNYGWWFWTGTFTLQTCHFSWGSWCWF
jgi:hypothetical protein